MSDLVANPCRRLCDWSQTGDLRAGAPLFSCTGCGSQWDRSQGWTPAQRDGRVPPAVLAERSGRVGTRRSA